MVSLAYLVVLLSALSAVVLADDVKTSQTESVDEKWFGNGYGYRWSGYASGIYNSGFGCTYPWVNRWGSIGAYGYFSNYPRVWFKEVETNTPARRSIVSQAEHIYRRDGVPVACKNTQGQTDHFVPADCHQAIQSLVSKKVSSFSCKSCAVKIVGPNGQLAAIGAPVEALQKVAHQILKSCATGADSTPNHARRSPSESSNSSTSREQFAIIFQKGDGTTCDA